MKKLQMLASLMLSMSSFLCGCRQENPLPVITVSPDVEISADGGELSIPVQISDLTETADLTAISSDEWLEIVSVSSNDIVVEATANTTDEVRRAGITLEYPGAKDAMVTVTQQPLESHYKISVYEEGYDVISVDVVPADKTSRYFLSAVPSEDFNPETVAEKYLATLRKYAELNGISVEEAVAANSFTGDVKHDIKGLYPNKEHTVFAYTINGSGEIQSSVSYVSGRTAQVPAGEMSGCRIEISASEISDNSAEITFTPDDNSVCYYTEVFDESGFSEISKDWNSYIYNYMTSRIIEPLTLETTIGIICKKGEYVAHAKGLSEQTKYYACAVGVDMNALIITEVYVHEFTTEEFVEFDYGIDFLVSDITSRGATVTATAKDSRAFYYWDVMTAEVYGNLGNDQEKIGEYFLEMMDKKRIEQYGDYADFFPLPDYIYMMCTSGSSADSHSYTSLSGGTEYYPYGFWVDETSGEKVSDAVFGSPFKTLERVVSSATAEASLWLTDGDRWSELSPVGYGHYAGKAILGARITHSQDAARWYSNIYEKSQLSYSDEELTISLIQQGQRNKDAYCLSYPVEWGGEYVILTVAEDADGNTGPLHKLIFTADKSVAEDLDAIPDL